MKISRIHCAVILLLAIFFFVNKTYGQTCTGSTPANPGARTGNLYTTSTIHPNTNLVHWVHGSNITAASISLSGNATLVIKTGTNVTTTGALVIPSGCKLYIESGAKLTLGGALTNSGDLINLGALSISGSVNLSTGSLYNDGALTASGYLWITSTSFTFLNGGTASFAYVLYQVASPAAPICLRAGSVFNLISTPYPAVVTGASGPLPAGGLFHYNGTDITGNPTCSPPNPARINYYQGYVPSAGFIYGPTGIFGNNPNITIVGSYPASTATGSCVRVTSGIGYSVSSPDKFNLNTHSPVPPVLGNYFVYCIGSVVPLASLVTGANLLWYTSATGGIGSPVAPVVNTSVAGLQSFWVSQNVTGTCEGPRNPIHIEVSSSLSNPPTLTVSNNGTCEGAPLALTGPGGYTDYCWTGPLSYLNNTQSPTVSSSATMAMNGIYTLTALQGIGACRVSGSTEVTIGSSPLGTVVVKPGTGANCSQITAHWNAVAGATSYLLDVSTVSNFTSFVSVYHGFNVGNVTSYTVSGLTAGTTYYYRLKAKNNCTISTSYSGTIAYATTNGPAITVQPVSQTACLGVPVSFTTVATGVNLSYQWKRNGVNVGTNSPVYTIPSPVPADDGVYTVVVSSPGCSSVVSNPAILVVGSVNLWLGLVNNNWFNPGNWACHVVPNQFLHALIPPLISTYPVIPTGTTATVKSITISPGASLTMVGNSVLRVYGDWINTGTFNASRARVEFVGIQALQTIINLGVGHKERFYDLTIDKLTGSVRVSSLSSIDIIAGGTVRILNGTLNLNGRPFTLKSAPNQNYNDGTYIHSIDSTARLGTVAGTLINASNFSIERYISATTVKPRMLSTSISNMSASQWADSVSIFGGDFRSLPGLPTNTSTLYRYNEPNSHGTGSNGWEAIIAKATILNPGQGYRLIVGYDNNPLYTSPPKPSVTLKMRGVPHIGNIAYSITKSGADPFGWNLLGNPFPCEMSWISFYNANSINVSATMAVLDPRSSGISDYYYYNAFTNTAIDPRYSVGVQPSTFGVTPRFHPDIIASSQAFFVYKTAVGSSLVNFTESQKVVSPGMIESNFRTVGGNTEKLNIVAVSHTGYSDNTYIFFSDDATASGYEGQYDAYKLPNTNLGVMTNTFGKDMAMNGVESNLSVLNIPLIVSSNTTGDHVLEIEDIESLAAGKEVYLIDHFTRNVIQLTSTNHRYSFTRFVDDTASTSRNRFTLQVTTHATGRGSIANSSKGSMSVYPNPSSGQIIITVSDVNSEEFRVEIIDSRGQLSYEQNSIIANGGQLVISNLDQYLNFGVYTLKLTSSSLNCTDKIILLK